MAGYTDLQLSILRGDDLRVIKSALSAPGCRVNARTPFGGSALLLAVEMDRVEVVELLVDAGADVGVLKPNGAHALILAAEFCKRDARVIDFLVSRGLEPRLHGRGQCDAQCRAEGEPDSYARAEAPWQRPAVRKQGTSWLHRGHGHVPLLGRRRNC